MGRSLQHAFIVSGRPSDQKVGADRIPFGSDDTQEGGLRFMETLRITDDDRAKIMGNNAAKLLNLWSQADRHQPHVRGIGHVVMSAVLGM